VARRKAGVVRGGRQQSKYKARRVSVMRVKAGRQAVRHNLRRQAGSRRHKPSIERSRRRRRNAAEPGRIRR